MFISDGIGQDYDTQWNAPILTVTVEIGCNGATSSVSCENLTT